MQYSAPHRKKSNRTSCYQVEMRLLQANTAPLSYVYKYANSVDNPVSNLWIIFGPEHVGTLLATRIIIYKR